MVRIAIIDDNEEYGLHVLHMCQAILTEKTDTIHLYSSIPKEEYDLFIVSESLIDSTLISKIQKCKNTQVMFYGDDYEKMLKSYEMNPFYFIMKKDMQTKLEIALNRGIKKLGAVK